MDRFDSIYEIYFLGQYNFEALCPREQVRNQSIKATYFQDFRLNARVFKLPLNNGNRHFIRIRCHWFQLELFFLFYS